LIEQTLSVSDLLEQSREVLTLAAQALRSDRVLPTGSGTSGVQSVDAALMAARRALSARLQSVAEPGSAASVAALILRAEQLQLSIRDALLAAQRQEVQSAQLAVNRLRAAVTTAALAERIPIEACSIGFTRVLFSYVKHGTWIARSAFAGDDRELAVAMVEIGAAHPRKLAGPLIEGEMVRCGQPILVRNVQTDSRVHTELSAITKSTDYVAAPVFAWGQPIGLVHADRHGDDYVAEFDRQTIGIFAEGLGIAFERNLMIERLEDMRRAANDHLLTANALADDYTVEVLELAGSAPLPSEGRGAEYSGQPRTSAADSQILSELTARESEVLRAIAAGKTNVQIATSLFVTEGTVKSHVKHILRKLGAGNRTEAVAKYHRAQAASASPLTTLLLG
jgi:DNA-binding CsgD family transcriptional regulator